MSAAIALTGEDALTSEEVRLLICSQAYVSWTDEEKETWRAAKSKLSRAKEAAHRLNLAAAKSDAGPVPEKTLPMYGGARMTVIHDAKLQELAYFQVSPPGAGEEEDPGRRRVTCAADLDQLDELIDHLHGVRAELAGDSGVSAGRSEEAMA